MISFFSVLVLLICRAIEVNYKTWRMRKKTPELLQIRENVGAFSSAGFLEMNASLGSTACLSLKITTHTSSRSTTRQELLH
uniref:Secreted protein n=1 Tax=Arundo donax TaxID=35708 RepID=A0A0A9GID3_ARUDO